MSHSQHDRRQINPPTVWPWVGVLVLALLLMASPTRAAEPIGKLIVAAGKIEAIGTDGKVRRLRRQAEIFKGDTLITGGNVFAQLRFKDGALIALRPDTEFQIEDYRFDGAENGSERAIFKLIKGGFRTITGAIGHKNKENYQVSTPVATIGIRGTHYGVRQITPELAAQRQQAGEDIQAGLYGGVVDGEIAVRNGGGENTFGNDRYFYVASADTAPETLIAPPGVVFDEDQPAQSDAQEEGDGEGNNQGQDGAQQASEEGEATDDGEAAASGDQQQADGGDADGDGNPAEDAQQTDSTADSADDGTASPTDGNSTASGGTVGVRNLVITINPDTATLANAVILDTTLVTSTESVFTSNETLTLSEAASSTYTRAPIGAGVIFGFFNRQNGTLELVSSLVTDDGSANQSISYDTGSNNNIQVKQLVTQGTGSNNQLQTHRFNFGTATLAESGKDAASGASWGRWTGDFEITTDGVNDTPVSDLHFVYSASQAASATIAAASSRAEPVTLYNWVDSASTSPTDLNGNTGSYEYFVIGVNFATQKLVGYEFKANVGGATYEVTLQNDQPLSEVMSDVNAQLTGKCIGCETANVAMTGNGSLMFIDDALSYIASSYALRDNNNLYGIAGAGVLESALTRTQEVSVANGATAHIAYISVDNVGTKHREVRTAVHNGTASVIKTATVNSVGNVVTNVIEGANTSNPTRFESNRALLTDTGGNTVGVNWGRWQDGWNASLSGTGRGSAGHAHYIYSDQVTTPSNYPTLSSASFNYVGGTKPTDEFGRAGSITSATMNVDFATQQINSYTLNATTPGRTWALSAAGAIGFATAKAGNLALNGTCTGCSTTTAVGNASAEFIGGNANYAISSFGASIGDNSNQIVGTALFQR